MERRRLNRTIIPGTKVQYRKMDHKSFFAYLSHSSEAINISKSGICFPTSVELSYGELVLIKILFPDGKKLKLKGYIRWQKSDSVNPAYQVGVQFNPFGASSVYNPLKALDYLRSLSGQRMEKIVPPPAEA